MGFFLDKLVYAFRGVFNVFISIMQITREEATQKASQNDAKLVSSIVSEKLEEHSPATLDGTYKKVSCTAKKKITKKKVTKKKSKKVNAPSRKL